MMVLLRCLTLVGTGALFVIVPKGFLPSEDQGCSSCSTEAAEGHLVRGDGRSTSSRWRRSSRRTRTSRRSCPPPAHRRPRLGQHRLMFVRLKPRRSARSRRTRSSRSCAPKLAKVPGIVCRPQNPPPIHIGGRLTQGQYQFTLQDPATRSSCTHSRRCWRKVRALPGFQDVTSDLQLKNPQVNVEIDRDKAAALGVSAGRSRRRCTTPTARGRSRRSTRPTTQYQVILELLPEYQLDPQALSLLYVQLHQRQAGAAERGGAARNRASAR